MTSATAGYSGTPLARKLGIKGDSTVALLGEPAGTVSPLPSTVTIKRQAQGSADVVVAFFTDRAAFARKVGPLSKMIFPDGGLWVAWPKRASGVATTMNEHVMREVGLPLGLVDNKVCAIDETWTAMRLVWRKERRR